VREEEEARGYIPRLTPLLAVVAVVIVGVVAMALLRLPALLHVDDGNGYQARPDARKGCELPAHGVLGPG